MSEVSSLLSASEQAYMRSSADPRAFKKAEPGVPSFLAPFADRQEVALIMHATASNPSTPSTDSLYKHAQHTLKLDSLRRDEGDELELNESHDDDRDSSDCDSLRGVPQAPSWRMQAMAVLWGSSSRDQYDQLLSPNSMPKPDSLSDTPDKQASAQHSSGMNDDVKEDVGTAYSKTAKQAAVSMIRVMKRAISTVKLTKFIWSKQDTGTERAEREKVLPKNSPPLRIAPLSSYMENDSCMEK